jgi:hypothetical protein
MPARLASNFSFNCELKSNKKEIKPTPRAKRIRLKARFKGL